MARGLLDVLREFSENENDFISVMETVARMSEDGGRRSYVLVMVFCCGFLVFPFLMYCCDMCSQSLQCELS